MTVIPFRKRDGSKPEPLLLKVFNHCSLHETPRFMGTWSEAELLQKKPIVCGSRAGYREAYGAVSVLRSGFLGKCGLREKVYLGLDRASFIRLRELKLIF